MADSCEVWFYHLERSGPDQVLPELLEKTLARGWRALVRCGAPERIEALEDWLWAYRDDSFLPHGRADAADPQRQPVLLETAQDGGGALNGAQALFLLDGAEPGALDGFARCVLLFDGRDEGAVAAARRRWREVRAAGCPSSYWRQSEGGGWRKEA